MAGRVAGKIAVITGAGSGMGRAMAEMFAAEGANVVCADISGQQEAVAASIGEAAIALEVDVTSAADVERMIATAAERFGRVDILCNNAGWGGPIGPFLDHDEAVFDRLIAVNLKGVYYGMRNAIPVMLRNGGGAIVNTSSASGMVGWKDIACYSATKAGVVQLTKSVALDYADQGIRVNAVCPGMTWTGMVPQSAGSREPPAGVNALPNIPMKRWGLDRDIAAAALYLASDEAAYVTGTTLPVDGGYVAG
jgi:NAD(P)-dependent dehydrogenase (short-subunit alcohol dehydrogenase family)